MPCSLGYVPVKMLDCALHVTAGNVGIITELLFSIILEIFFVFILSMLDLTNPGISRTIIFFLSI